MGKTTDNEVQKKNAKFEDAVALTGFGIFNLELLFAAGGTLMVVIIETMAMMFIVPASQCDLELTLGTKGVLSAISFFGVVSSSHFWGFIADTRGRRNILMISMYSSFVTSLLSSIVPQAWIFILMRFLNGVAVGGASSVVYAYLGEFHDKIHRPKVVSWVATFVAFGNMIIPGFAWLILPLEFSYEVPVLDVLFKPWRFLIICYGISSLVFGLWLLRFPESPKYLLADGKPEEALSVLKLVYSTNTGKDPESFPVSGLIPDESDGVNSTEKVGILRSMWNQTVPLLKKPHGLKTFMVCILQFTAFACSSGLLMWYPELLNMLAVFAKTNPDNISVCASVDYANAHKPVASNLTTGNNFCNDQVDTGVFLISLLIGCSFAVMYIVIGSIINFVGPKNLLLIFTVVTTLCGIGAQYVQGLEEAQALMGVFLAEATCVGVVNAITVELFPTQLRAMALAISLMAGRVGAMVGANVTGTLIYNACEYLFYIFGIDHLILVITVLLLPAASREKKMIVPNV